MSRKHDVKNINLQIDDLVPFANEKYVGFTIKWSSNIGFGEYEIYKPQNDDVWHGDSECMDSNTDKEFITELMRVFVEKLVVD